MAWWVRNSCPCNFFTEKKSSKIAIFTCVCVTIDVAACVRQPLDAVKFECWAVTSRVTFISTSCFFFTENKFLYFGLEHCLHHLQPHFGGSQSLVVPNYIGYHCPLLSVCDVLTGHLENTCANFLPIGGFAVLGPFALV
jgi:hypothetical protein